MPKLLHHYTRCFVPFSKHLLASFVEISGGFMPLVLFIPRSRELLSSWNSLSKGNNIHYKNVYELSQVKSISMLKQCQHIPDKQREKKLYPCQTPSYKMTTDITLIFSHQVFANNFTFSFHQVIAFLWVLWYSLHIAAYVEVAVALLCLWMHSLDPQTCIFQCQWKASCGKKKDEIEDE